MKARTILLGAIAALAPILTAAATIDRAVFTEVVNSVRVIEPVTKKMGGAKVQEEFSAPNILRTGADSRAEMIAGDQTVTRVGQNTVFSFEPNSREVNLEKGSILFQSQSGKGGGTIKTPSASAAVLGTTLIVTTTKNGGFKVLLVEGKGRVKAGDGSVRTLTGGQLVYALPGGKLSNVFEFRLSQQVGASKLVSGFKKPLPSAGKIAAAIATQEKDIANGGAIVTNLLASGSPNYAYQVDVARDAIVRKNEEVSAATPLQTAATTDAIIFEPALDTGRIFGPAELEVSGEVAPYLFEPENSAQMDDFARSADPQIFVANNILFATPTVNFAPYEGRDVFQFLAVNDVLFDQSVNLGKFSGELQFLAGGTMQAVPGVSVVANAKRLTFLAVGSFTGLGSALPAGLQDFKTDVPFTLTRFAAFNEGGGLDLLGGDVQLQATIFRAVGDVRVAAVRDLTARGEKGSALLFPNSDAAGIAPRLGAGMSDFSSLKNVNIFAGRDFLATGVGFRGSSVRLASAGRMSLRTVQIQDSTAPASPTSEGSSLSLASNVRLYAADLLSLNRVNFYANGILMQSNTLLLQDVNFRSGSRVILESNIGRLAQIGAASPPRPGFVNVVGNSVRYGGTPVAPNSSVVIQNGPAPTPGGPGVIVRPFLRK